MNSVEEAVGAIVEVMQENPTLILKVIGCCDAQEKNCAKLSLARADLVKDMLLEKGIPAIRLQAEGREKSYRYSQAEIAAIKDRREREMILARDRHVDYLVVGFTDKP